MITLPGNRFKINKLNAILAKYVEDSKKLLLSNNLEFIDLSK